jgi:hypothetical protein
MLDMPFSYTTQSRVLAFSEKIKCFSKDNSTYSQISEIFYEKEEYGIPLLTAKVIKNLIFPDKSEKAFCHNINNYNNENNTQLTFDDFKETHWIRIIQDEVVLPQVIYHKIWAINKDNSEKEITELSENRRDMALCLANYVKSHDEPFITKEQLSLIQSSLHLTQESIDFLLKKHILEYNNSNMLYYWRGRIHYQEPFGNEISALLWILIKKDFQDHQKAFQKYIYLINKTNLTLRWIDNLLNDEDQQILYEQAIVYIQNDKDLLVCDDELEKIRLDSVHNTRNDINKTTSSFNLKSNSINELFEKFDLLENKRELDLLSQGTKKYFFNILHLIMQYEQKNIIDKKYTIKFMIDFERPSIILMTKFILKNNYPQMIPYLISCIELIPLVFRLLDDIDLNEKMIVSHEGINIKNEEIYSIRNELWIDLFKITLDLFIDNYNFENNKSHEKYETIGSVISCLFLDTVRNIFCKYNTYHPTDIITNAMQKRYTSSFQIFQRAKTKFNIYNKGFYIKSNISYFLLPKIAKNIGHNLKNTKMQYGNHFDFNIVSIDVMIDMLGIAIVPFDTIGLGDAQKKVINDILPESIKCIYDYFCYFLSIEKIEFIDYDFEKKIKDVEIIFDINKLDRTNWSLLIMFLNQYEFLNKLIECFDSSIIFVDSKKRYDYPNQNHYYRIQVMFRILLYAYLNLKEEKKWYDFPIHLQEKTTVYLEELIIKYALRYSKDDITNGRIDAFDDNVALGFNQRYSILSLLFFALNYFSINTQEDFASRFFMESINLRQMLTAINIIESDEVKNIITDHIDKIDIEKFIESCFTVTEWEKTLIEAINSEKHWNIAQRLVVKIKSHYKKRDYHNEQIDLLLYQVELSLALRNKDLKKLCDIQYRPQSIITHHENNIDDIRTYFIVLHWLENKKDYDKTISLLKSLLSKDINNVRYFLLLYKARFYKALVTEGTNLIDRDEVFTAWHEWEKFKEIIGDDANKIAEQNNELIALYTLPYYILTKNEGRFDSEITSIPDDLLYESSKLTKLIYDFYVERNLDSFAFRFLNKADKYFKKRGITVPAIINELLVNPDNPVLTALAESFKSIVTSNYRNIPLITPQSINGKRELSLFILNELIKATKQLQDRIKAIGIEDNYTDLIQSILTMRFPFYGWYTSEQAHRGKSESGNRSGETDLIVKANDEDIALIEALILTGGNFSETNDHILKTLDYSKRLDRYYIIVYYKGKQDNFLSCWETYKQNVMKIYFPNGNNIKYPESPFIVLDSEFDNARTFKIAKTCHEKDFEMFHIMADFSDN